MANAEATQAAAGEVMSPRRRTPVAALEAFVGSQSLRGLELDRRREVGLVVRNRKLARQLQAAFEADWEQSES